MIKTRLSLAVLAATLALTGCIGEDEPEQVVTESYVGFDPVVAAADGAGRSPVIPFPFDALFAGAKTPTLNIPNSVTNPNALVTQANLQDGFSTTASMFMDIFGYVDMATVPANIIIIKRGTTQPLVYGTDFTVESSTVKDSSGAPISAQRTRLLIEPLKPLAASSTYVIALKKGIKTLNGGMVQPSFMFNALNSATPVASRTDSYFTRFSATEKATLEALRSQLIRPITTQLAALGVTDVLLAYSVTTQSTTKTLDKLAAKIANTEAVATDIAVFSTGKTPQDLNPALGVRGANSDVYLGTLKVPYYNDIPSEANPTAILSSYWKADAAMPDVDAAFLGTPKACGAYAAGLTVNGIKLEPSISTTTCFPMPKEQSTQTIPMLVTVPKGAKPEGGWPVVIFQHGITGNRTNMLAIAPAFAQAGFVTVAIDLPLHGITPTDAASGLRITGVSERTFDVDVTGKPATGTAVAGSGTHFINLASPITTRDGLRQGAADILVLAKNLANLNVDGVAGGDVNMSQVRFSGISLGAIVGTVALGADKDANLIKAASLSVGSGALPKLLDASKSYGPIIAGGLAANKVLEDTDSYESFMRFAQTLADSGDPINFAMAAKMNRPIHFTQVLNDLVVPNTALKGAASATKDFVGATGFLSGNTALAKTMGFMTKKDITVDTVVKENVLGSAWIEMQEGSHGSLINPVHPKVSDNDDATVATDAEKAIFLAVTTEMQCQTVKFLASSGAIVPVGCSKPAAVVEAVEAN